MITNINTNTNPKEPKQPKSPLKAIRAHCIECMCGSPNEVRLCPIDDCPLFPFRFGKNPFRVKKEYTEEQRAALVAQLQKGKNKVAEKTT